MRIATLLFVLFLAAFSHGAKAQTGCTPAQQAANLTALQDSSTAGAVSRGTLRNLACSTDLNTYDAAGYGALCNGSNDDSTPINTAASAANTAGGGRVLFPAGTCITTGITIYPNVVYQGQGRDTTIVKLKNTTNTSIFISQNFASLTGTDSTAGVGGFGIQALTIDGNKANNTSGGGVQIYGYGFDIKDVSIRNTPGTDALYTEWSSSSSCPTNSPPDCMEAFFSNILIHDYKGNGWTYKGPHDSQVNRIIIYSFDSPSGKGLNLTAATNGSSNALTGTTVHVWGTNQWGLYADQKTNGVELYNVLLEGATNGQLMNGGYQNQFDGTIYNCADDVSVTAQQTGATTLVVTANSTGSPISPGMLVSGSGTTAGEYITAGTVGLTGTFTTTSAATTGSEAMTIHGPGLWYGDSLNSGTQFGSRIRTVMSNSCGVGWAFEGGNNQLDLTIQDGGAMPQVGGPSNYQTDQITSWNFINGLNNLTVSACGTTPNANSSIPAHGQITLGTGSPTACTITVGSGNAWPRAPICSVTPANGTAWGMSASSTTAVTFTGSATTTSLRYQCTP